MSASLQLLTRATFRDWLDPPLLGMVHLEPLPGSPCYAGDPDLPLRRALEDASALTEAGFSGVLVENYGDRPFFGHSVPAVTIAAMARIVAAIAQRWPSVKLGVNCLRNDAAAAVSIAAACGADAVRVNVHVGAMVTDQGVLRGTAARTLRLRAALGSNARILADLRVKHAVPVSERPATEEALDLRDRGLADVVLLTGTGTGRPASTEPLGALREALPDTPLMVASGVTLESAQVWAPLVEGAIVGSSVMHGGRAGAGVDAARAGALVQAWGRR